MLAEFVFEVRLIEYIPVINPAKAIKAIKIQRPMVKLERNSECFSSAIRKLFQLLVGSFLLDVFGKFFHEYCCGFSDTDVGKVS